MSSTMIGKYRVIRALGAGTTAKVKLAEDTETNELVAIKIIKKAQFEQKPDLERKIKREVALMRLLDHPHLLRLIEVCESPHHMYIVLEYAEHGELFDYLVSRRRLEPEQAMNFFRQLIYALEYLHNHAICHRDLKPENILLDSTDHIKVADFGFARWMRSNIAETSCGSPHYAAPEVIRGEIYDGRGADIWSCGVILYALLAGRLPFDDPSIRALLAKVKTGRFAMPNFQPACIQTLIAQMLTVDVRSRITLEGIKQSQAFRLFLPDSYRLPKPLPLPYMTEPIPEADVDKAVVTILLHLGYESADDVMRELQAPESTMAKTFYFMLTARLNPEALPWDGEGSGASAPAEAFLMEPKAMPMGSAPFALPGADAFFRRPKFPAAGSPSFYSFVERSSLLPDADIPSAAVASHQFETAEADAEAVMCALQLRLDEEGYQFFFPNDTLLVVRHPEMDAFAMIALRFETVTHVSLTLQQTKGSALAFESLVQIIDDFLTTFS